MNPAVRNKAEITSFQKVTCITVIDDKKIENAFCVSRVLYSSPQFPVQIKYFLQTGSIFSWNPQRKRKNANQHLV